MWLYVLSCVCGFLAGATVVLAVVAGIRDRLVLRLEAVRTLAETQRDLENRRVAYDSGRELQARSHGGRPGRVVDAMGTKPGTLAKYLRNK